MPDVVPRSARERREIDLKNKGIVLVDPYKQHLEQSSGQIVYDAKIQREEDHCRGSTTFQSSGAVHGINKADRTIRKILGMCQQLLEGRQAMMEDQQAVLKQLVEMMETQQALMKWIVDIIVE